jgi:serine/threonine protein phosphatase PrpC/CRP-like cAMP-binding protein
MDVQVWATTDTGRAREHNEDNFLVDKGSHLFVVCDGMGGHAAGEVASSIAVRAIQETISNCPQTLARSARDSEDSSARRDLIQLLEFAVHAACARIFRVAQEQPEKRGMGTTCSLLTLQGRRAYIAHVGDSRIYLLRKGRIHLLTEDHTLANEMVRRGKVRSVDEVEAKYQSTVTRAVGVYESVEVDTLDFDCLPGDRFLLCSDGLSRYLDDHATMVRFLGPWGAMGPSTEENLKEICGRLIRFANSMGGKDNITAVCVDVVEVAAGGIEAEEIRLSMETLRSVAFFQYLSYKELVQVASAISVRLVDVGEALTCEGEAGDRLFIVMRGSYAASGSGRDSRILGPGDHFGELGLVDEEPALESVRCVEGGALISISREDFFHVLRGDQSLAVKLLWNLVHVFSSTLRYEVQRTPDAPGHLRHRDLMSSAGFPAPPPG